mgnify:CR=1 FL=1
MSLETAALCVLIAAAITVAAMGSYWQLPRFARRRIGRSTLIHYIPREHIEWRAPAGTVHVRARCGWYNLGFTVRRMPAAFFYIGWNGRGGWLNHSRTDRSSTLFYRIEIRGADFLDRVGTDKLWLRLWDRALMIRADYNGPGMIALCEHPAQERKTYSPSSNDNGAATRAIR